MMNTSNIQIGNQIRRVLFPSSSAEAARFRHHHHTDGVVVGDSLANLTTTTTTTTKQRRGKRQKDRNEKRGGRGESVLMDLSNSSSSSSSSSRIIDSKQAQGVSLGGGGGGLLSLFGMSSSKARSSKSTTVIDEPAEGETTTSTAEEGSVLANLGGGVASGMPKKKNPSKRGGGDSIIEKKTTRPTVGKKQRRVKFSSQVRTRTYRPTSFMEIVSAVPPTDDSTAAAGRSDDVRHKQRARTSNKSLRDAADMSLVSQSTQDCLTMLGGCGTGQSRQKPSRSSSAQTPDSLSLLGEGGDRLMPKPDQSRRRKRAAISGKDKTVDIISSSQSPEKPSKRANRGPKVASKGDAQLTVTDTGIKTAPADMEVESDDASGRDSKSSDDKSDKEDAQAKVAEHLKTSIASRVLKEIAKKDPVSTKTRSQVSRRLSSRRQIQTDLSSAEDLKESGEATMNDEEFGTRRSTRRQLQTDRFSPESFKETKKAKRDEESHIQSSSRHQKKKGHSSSENKSGLIVNDSEAETRRSSRRQIQTDRFSPEAAEQQETIQRERARQTKERKAEKKTKKKKAKSKCGRKRASIPEETKASSKPAPVATKKPSKKVEDDEDDFFEDYEALRARQREEEERRKKEGPEPNRTDEESKQKKSGAKRVGRPKKQAATQEPSVIANRQLKKSAVDQLGDGWTEKQLAALKKAHSKADPMSGSFWADVASLVDGKEASDCREKWFSLIKTPAAKPKKASKEPPAQGPSPCEDDIFNATPMRRNLLPIDDDESGDEVDWRNSNTLDIDVGSPIVVPSKAAKSAAGVDDEYEHRASARPAPSKPGYKTYLLGLKRGISRATKDRKGKRTSKDKEIDTRKKLSEYAGSGQVEFNGHLTPGGTLKVKNLMDDDGVGDDDFFEDLYDVNASDSDNM